MNKPSIKALTKAFGADKAKEIRAIMDKEPQPCHCANRMELIDEALGTCGVEYIPHGRNANSPAIWYCNEGDPYSTTILFVRGSFRIGCWGDIVERGNYQ